MLSAMIVSLVLAANPSTPMTPVEPTLFVSSPYDAPAPVLPAASWLWHRIPRNPRFLQPNREYYQSHVYDPRLRLDYPWHAPRVRAPVCPPYPADMADTAYEF